MARIRTVKPEFWTDSFMVQLPPLARLIYIALWTTADDHGCIPDEPERLAMEVMPREDQTSFDDWLQFFHASGRIELHVNEDGSAYYRVSKWDQHQRVDKPSRSKFAREGSRKFAIPLEVRREVARKYGCSEGVEIEAPCYYCGVKGRIHWHRLFNGRPSAWVTFPGLELDHLEPQHEGGENTQGNIVLSCRNCNRSKGTRHWVARVCEAVGSGAIPQILARPREPSCEEQGTGNREQGKKTDVGLPPDAAQSKSKNAALRKQAAEIITFLNEKASRNFDVNGANADHVIARLRDGESVEDCRAVIALKCREWKGDERLAKFLRPETLFNRTKFASYKGELAAPQESP